MFSRDWDRDLSQLFHLMNVLSEFREILCGQLNAKAHSIMMAFILHKQRFWAAIQYENSSERDDIPSE